MDEETLRKGSDLAHALALGELVRMIIAHITYSEDPEQFRRNLQHVERRAIDTLAGRKLWPDATEEANTFVLEAASEYITRLLLSIRHPSERP